MQINFFAENLSGNHNNLQRMAKIKYNNPKLSFFTQNAKENHRNIHRIANETRHFT